MYRHLLAAMLMIIGTSHLSCNSQDDDGASTQPEGLSATASQCSNMANNFVLNCGFESDADHWITADDTQYSWQSAEVHSGSGAGKIVAEWWDNNQWRATLLSQCALLGEVSKPVTKQVGIWLKTPHGDTKQVTCVLAWFMSESSDCNWDSVEELASGYASLDPNGWVQVAAEGSIPPYSYSFSTLVVQCVGGGSEEEGPFTVLLDDAYLTPPG